MSASQHAFDEQAVVKFVDGSALIPAGSVIELPLPRGLRYRRSYVWIEFTYGTVVADYEVQFLLAGEIVARWVYRASNFVGGDSMTRDCFPAVSAASPSVNSIVMTWATGSVTKVLLPRSIVVEADKARIVHNTLCTKIRSYMAVESFAVPIS
jgi:hypothetical protein